MTAIKKPTDIHVGSLIRAHIAARKVSKAALARSISRDDNSIQDFLKRPSLQSYILVELSHALKHNFFTDIAAMLPPDYTTTVLPDNTKDIKIAALEHEIEILKAEKAVLMEMGRKSNL